MKLQMRGVLNVLKVNYRKRIYEYKEKEMPQFSNRRAEHLWLQSEKKEALLLNIKSIDIQVKDVKKMIFSDKSALLCLYSKFIHFDLDDEEYITVNKRKSGNDWIIYTLITSTWILNESELGAKDIEQIKQELIEIRKNINNIMQNPKLKKDISLKNWIVLLGYKESELTEYLNRRENQNHEEKAAVLQKQISSKKNN